MFFAVRRNRNSIEPRNILQFDLLDITLKENLKVNNYRKNLADLLYQIEVCSLKGLRVSNKIVIADIRSCIKLNQVSAPVYSRASIATDGLQDSSAFAIETYNGNCNLPFCVGGPKTSGSCPPISASWRNISVILYKSTDISGPVSPLETSSILLSTI